MSNFRKYITVDKYINVTGYCDESITVKHFNTLNLGEIKIYGLSQIIFGDILTSFYQYR